MEFLLQNYIEQLECGVQKSSLSTGTRTSSTQPPNIPAVPQSNDSQHSKPASDTALMRISVFYSKFTTWPSSASTTAASLTPCQDRDDGMRRAEVSDSEYSHDPANMELIV